MGKNSEIAEQRVNQIVQWMEDGRRFTEMVQLCSERYALKTRQAKHYISLAKVRTGQRETQRQAIITETEAQTIRDNAHLRTLSYLEKRNLLFKIANQEIEVEEIAGKEPATIKRKPNAREIVDAINEDNRMSGEHAAKQVQKQIEKRSITTHITFKSPYNGDPVKGS